MAVAVATTSTQTWATGSTTLTLTKPTSTADGDFLVAIITLAKDISVGTISAVPSGWTQQQTSVNTSGLGRVYAYYKTASSEGASWDWTISNSANYSAGCVLRITGATTITSSDDGTDNNTATPSFTGGVTPISESLLIMALCGTDVTTDPTTVASYAITTSNPTWTEVIDVNNSAPPDMQIAVAYANRPEVTATGDWTLTYSAGSFQDSVSLLMTIPATANASISPTVIASTIAVQAPTVSGGATVSPSVISNTLAVQAPTVTLTAPKWVNTDKSSAGSITNTPKS